MRGVFNIEQEGRESRALRHRHLACSECINGRENQQREHGRGVSAELVFCGDVQLAGPEVERELIERFKLVAWLLRGIKLKGDGKRLAVGRDRLGHAFEFDSAARLKYVGQVLVRINDRFNRRAELRGKRRE